MGDEYPRTLSRLIAIALLFLLSISSAAAQSGASAVFLDRTGAPSLVFVDLNSGEQTRVDANGERFTVLSDSVIFFDARNRSVKVVSADGQIETHPFLTLTGAETRVEWVVSSDGERIAWTTIEGSAPSNISTVTRVAGIDGANARTVFQETRQDGVRVQPVAFSPDGSRLYLDYHPDGLDALVVFPQYAGLFALDLSLEDPQASMSFLPDEPGDFTGAGFGSGYFVRLGVSAQLAGFDLQVTQLSTNAEWGISPAGGGYSIAGDVLISPDGRYAVYAQAALQGIGTGTAQAETVIMRVDLAEMSQSALTSPLEGVMRPVAWSEEDAAVILVSASRPGTWKARMSDGRVQQVAELTYIGQISR
jgi:hypothetical protein